MKLGNKIHAVIGSGTLAGHTLWAPKYPYNDIQLGSPVTGDLFIELSGYRLSVLPNLVNAIRQTGLTEEEFRKLIQILSN